MSTHTPSATRVRWRPALVEVASSVTAVVAMGALFFNLLDAELAFLGETAEPTREHVVTYRSWLTVLGVAVVLGFVAALRRRGLAARSLYWHGVVLAAACFAAVAFHVTTGEAEPTPVEDDPGGNHVCFSGGDSDECVGG
jgi:hypothetical protein